MARATGSKSTFPLSLEQLTELFKDTPKAKIPVSVGFLRAAQTFLNVEIPGLEDGAPDEQAAGKADAPADGASGGGKKPEFTVE